MREETRRNLETLNNSTNSNTMSRHNIIPYFDDENYNNISVPVSIVDQECDIIQYISGENSQDICPIDRIPFEENESVMRIRFCGHIFRENNLRENFRSRATCPVCRHNIITTVTRNISNESINSNYQNSDIQWFIRY